VARPVLKEGKIILATPIVRRLPQWVLVLLQRMKHNPRSCGVVRRMLARGARKQCEGPRRWMTGGRARMASSVIGSLGPPWMMVKEPAMYARLLLFNFRFRFHLLLL
jgi:hypothetical protein